MTEHFITLSTTEPNNFVGLLKMRQGDINTQTIQATITANGQLFNFDRLSVFFNAVLPNGNVIRDKVTEVDYVSSKLNYIVADSFLQEVAQVTAWFSFENGEKIIDSTKNFQYSVIGGWKECIPQGNYIYELSEIQREIEEIVGRKDFTTLLSELDYFKTNIDYLENVKISQADLNKALENVVSGSPKGTFENKGELSAAFPNGSEGIYVTKDDGNWNYWSGTAWEAGGTYQALKLTTEAVAVENIESDVFRESYFYKGTWVNGYVASASNSTIPEGSITTQSGEHEYMRSDYIPVHKGEVVAIECQAFDGLSGVALFDRNKNYVKSIQADYNPLFDLIYIPTDDLEFIIVSNAFKNLSNPTIRVTKNLLNSPDKQYPLSNSGYNYYINPITLTTVGTSAYFTSKCILVKETDNLILSLYGSTGTSVAVECDQSGKAIKNIQTGILEKGQRLNISPVGGFKIIRFINRNADFAYISELAKVTPLKNSRFAMIGDSYVKGNKTNENLTAYNIAAQLNTLTYVNYGINGNTIATYDTPASVPISERYEDMLNDFDIVGFEGGRNDYNKNIPIGLDSDMDNTTFKGALNVLCQGMIKKYLGKKIFGVPCWTLNTNKNAAGATQNDYLEAFVHIVRDLWGIPVLDSRSSGVFMNSKDFLEKYTEDGNSISHLNAAGHVLFSGKVSKFIQGL